ncbi:hypothetical protein Tco_1420158 [Tanacetum coccineum]
MQPSSCCLNHRPMPYAKFQALNQSIEEVVKTLMKRNLWAEVKVLLEEFDCDGSWICGAFLTTLLRISDLSLLGEFITLKEKAPSRSLGRGTHYVFGKKHLVGLWEESPKVVVISDDDKYSDDDTSNDSQDYLSEDSSEDLINNSVYSLVWIPNSLP